MTNRWTNHRGQGGVWLQDRTGKARPELGIFNQVNADLLTEALNNEYRAGQKNVQKALRYLIGKDEG